MPVNAQIPLQVQNPKFVGPGELLSLKDLATRAEANRFSLDQAKLMAPQTMRLNELKAMSEQNDMMEKMAKRRKELSSEVNTRAYTAYQAALATGASNEVAEAAKNKAWQDALDEQEASGMLSIAGIGAPQIAQARTKIPTFAEIQSRVLTPEQATERADYAATAPNQMPLAQVGNMQPPVMPPAGIEADLLGNGPVRQPAQNVPLELPPTEVTAIAPPNSPDEWRKEGNRLRKIGTKVAMEQAQKAYEEADRLDKRSLDAQGKEDAQSRLKLDREKFEFDKLKEQNDRENKGKTVEQKDKELTTKLSDDYEKNQAVKDYKTVQPLVASMENAFQKDSGAADLDMVYALAKIYDPGSVVREGEQVLVVKSGGLPSQVQDWIGWVNGGQRLSSAVRKGMVEQAKSRADNYKQASDAVASSYRRQAKEWGLNADNIVREYTITARENLGKGPRREDMPQRRSSDGLGGLTQQEYDRLQELERKRGAK